MEITPPFVPKVDNKGDVANIDEEFLQEMPAETLMEYTSLMKLH